MKKWFQYTLLFSLFTVTFISCKSPEGEKTATPVAVVDIEKIRPEIQALDDAYAAAEFAKDAEAVAAYYHDDAILYHSNAEPSVGKAAIKQRIAERHSKDSSGNKEVYKIVDLYAFGEGVVEIGSWTTVDTSGNPVENGHFMAFLQKQDGKYKCIREMSVSSKKLQK